MQLMDKIGVFKDWNTLKHEHRLKIICISQWMQLVYAIPSYWKNNMKQNNINNYIYNSKTSILTLFRMVFFGGCSQMGGGGGGGGECKTALPKICYTSYKEETWHSYTLTKKDQKLYESSGIPLAFCWHQHFLT